MKINLLFVAVAGLTLVSASPPSDPIPWEDEESLRNYPRCSASVTDRCIQTNERGTARRENIARNDSGDSAEAPVAHGAKHASADYPPCSSTVTDRCIQTREQGSTRMARAAAPKKYRSARPTQLAMRAGERG